MKKFKCARPAFPFDIRHFLFDIRYSTFVLLPQGREGQRVQGGSRFAAADDVEFRCLPAGPKPEDVHA